MDNIESTLLNAIGQYADVPIVIAYSGGVDSQVLLHAFSKLIQSHQLITTIKVCHVNHGLSRNAEHWQNFAQQQCQLRKIPLKICQVNVKPQAQESLEALAREARYKALHGIYEQASLIITGHHLDDQAETFLLALKRGSGLKGLSAMAKNSQKGKDTLLRPFLTISRAEIVAYAKQHKLTWIEDESNLDNRFDRNFIRNDIMPLLVDRWPSITHSIKRSSDHCKEGQLLLDELAGDDLRNSQVKPKCLAVKSLILLSDARFNNLIRYFLAQYQCLMASTEQLKQLRQQLMADSDKNPAVKVGEHYLRRHKEHLFLTPSYQDISNWQCQVNLLTTGNKIKLPDNLGQLSFNQEKVAGQIDKPTIAQMLVKHKNLVQAPLTGQQVSIRFSHTNPTCLPDYRNHSRALKKVLQELNIAPWLRKRIPFLYYDDTLVAAIGYFVCQPFQPHDNEAGVSVNWFIEP